MPPLHEVDHVAQSTTTDHPEMKIVSHSAFVGLLTDKIQVWGQSFPLSSIEPIEFKQSVHESHLQQVPWGIMIDYS